MSDGEEDQRKQQRKNVLEMLDIATTLTSQVCALFCRLASRDGLQAACDAAAGLKELLDARLWGGRRAAPLLP